MQQVTETRTGGRRLVGAVRGGLLSAAAAVACLLPAAAAAALLPTGDVREEFKTDPRGKGSWSITGSWAWDGTAGTLVSGATRPGSAIWKAGASYTGSIRTRLKLIAGAAGAPAEARVVFARDPATGAHRYVQLTSGTPGTVVLAQAGTIRGGKGRVIRSQALTIPRGRPLDLDVSVGEKGRVTVRLGGTLLFTESVLPVAPGEVGFASRASKVAFDRFVFVAAPDAEPCEECHAANGPAKAANVYTYWDGGWWDRRQGGSPSEQQGGHGDPGGKYAMQCTGGAGCHSMRLPAPQDHRNGVFEPRENLTTNPWHLRASFINPAPVNPWDVQLTFDDTCATACHEGYGVSDMRHKGITNGREYLQLGFGLTDPAARSVPEGYPLDTDLTSLAGDGQPFFGTCVTCHDPHGTGATDATHGSNHMVRLNYATKSDLCMVCHQ